MLRLRGQKSTEVDSDGEVRETYSETCPWSLSAMRMDGRRGRGLLAGFSGVSQWRHNIVTRCPCPSMPRRSLDAMESTAFAWTEEPHAKEETNSIPVCILSTMLWVSHSRPRHTSEIHECWQSTVRSSSEACKVAKESMSSRLITFPPKMWPIWITYLLWREKKGKKKCALF